MNNQEVKFSTIKDAIDSFMDDYSFSQAVLDALNASLVSKEALEALFTKQLWVWEDFTFDSEEHKQYYITLGQIEQILVANSLIYNA